MNRLLSANSTCTLDGRAPPSDDSQVGKILESYLQSLERGQSPDIDALLQQHPDLADKLEPSLRKLAALHRMSERLQSPETSDPLTDAIGQDGTLGDYRILREIGRGGMGIVYEAEQISLRRRVALKVLPFAAVLDPRHLQRFKNEALAAASLDHPNIVEVYGVGCERGVHFYAMRYVEGQTLAAVIDGLRDQASGIRRQEKPESSVAAEHSVPGTQYSISDRDDAIPPSQSPTLSPEPPSPDARRLTPPPLPLTPHPSPLTETSVAAALTTLRTTKPREYYRHIANLGIQAAEALDHAHQMGIVHRDIKPSNLILECSHRECSQLAPRDESDPLPLRGEAGRGVNATLKPDARRLTPLLNPDRSLPAAAGPLATPRLYITDFGLARIISDSAPGLTMTGDLLGTLRYMSPEQALAKRITVDHRTDIYSLGITLYELLALQPACDGADREEVLRQIAFEEPAPLRRRKSSIPIELETIIHKAISKNPDDRYPTAGELSEDLRRFVASEPIRAKPPTALQRAMRWSRRHQVAVLAGLVVLAMLTIGLSVGSIIIVRERNDAIAARNEATEHFQLARAAVDKLATRVAEEQLLNAPQMEHLREKLLTDALSFYQQMLKRDSDNPALRHEVALAQVRVGDILYHLNRREEGATAHSDAIRRLHELAASDPKNSQFKLSLAKALYGGAVDLASVELYSARNSGTERQTAIDNCAEAVKLLEQLNEESPNKPEFLTALADAYRQSADPYIQDSYGTAVERLLKARAIVEPLARGTDATNQRKDLHAKILRRLGETLPSVGRREDGRLAFQEAIRLFREQLQTDPTDAERRDLLAGALWNCANAFPPEKIDDLVAIWKECVQTYVGLVGDFPSVPKHSGNLAMARMHLCFAYRKANDHSAALKELVQGKTVLEKLCREFPRYKDGFNLMERIRWQLIVEYEMQSRVDDWLREADEYRRATLARTKKLNEPFAEYVTALFELTIGNRLVLHGRNAEGIEWGREGFRHAWHYLQAATQEEKEKVLHCSLQAFRDGEFTKDITDLLGGLAIDLFNAGQTEAASEFWRNLSDVWHLSKASKDQGQYHAYLGRYADAAKQFKAAALADPHDHWAASRAARTLLISGDREGYEAMCRRLLDHFGDTRDWLAAWNTSAACLFTPSSIVEPVKLVQLTEVAMPTWRTARSPPYYLRALAAYRAGDWKDALTWCAKDREATDRDEATDHWDDHRAVNLFVESMALHRLGKFGDATRAYDEAIALAHKAFPSATAEQLGVGPEWIMCLWCQQLRLEAEALLQKTATADPPQESNQSPARGSKTVKN